jgi:hypothetical protein
MTNPTTNFGWVMPSPTDLVTDLPADFEVFGQAVDTDFVDLLGGANGYILSKASATDLDFAWIPNDQGDITAVNVTSPITGGGSAGAVTIGINAATTSVVGAVQLSDSTSTTSSVLASTPTATKAAYDLANTANTTADAAIAKSTLTTAGDIVYRNATVPVRLGIGTAGQVLKVNSGATAPEWGTPTAGATIISVRKSANQSITSSTTLTNDSQLKFAIGANETWVFYANLQPQSTAGGIHIKYAFTYPAGATLTWSPPNVVCNADGVVRIGEGFTGTTSVAMNVDNLIRPNFIMGSILNGGTAGDLQLQWAQNVSSATAMTMNAGSFITGTKVS